MYIGTYTIHYVQQCFRFRDLHKMHAGNACILTYYLCMYTSIHCPAYICPSVEEKKFPLATFILFLNNHNYYLILILYHYYYCSGIILTRWSLVTLFNAKAQNLCLVLSMFFSLIYLAFYLFHFLFLHVCVSVHLLYGKILTSQLLLQSNNHINNENADFFGFFITSSQANHVHTLY